MDRNEVFWVINMFLWWINLGLIVPMTPAQIQVIIIMVLIVLYEPLCVILWRCELDKTTKDLYNLKA